ncbi:MAG: hypothetical protein ABI415_02795 [Flavitalea sp.]
MKSLTLVIFLIVPILTSAQGVFTNQTNTALQKVIADYSVSFRNIKGPIVSQGAQTTDYSSKVQIPGSISSIITQYNSSSKDVYSWKCVLMQSEDFDVISKKYKELHNQIGNSIIKIDGAKPFILNGNYEIPTDEKKFNTSTFYLLPSTGEMRNLKVELNLEFYVTEWKIELLVYDQEDQAHIVKD